MTATEQIDALTADGWTLRHCDPALGIEIMDKKGSASVVIVTGPARLSDNNCGQCVDISPNSGNVTN